MATKTSRKRSNALSTLQRTRRVMSAEVRAAYGEIQQGVKFLEKAIAEIQRDVRKAERKIEVDARARIHALRKDARTQLGVLRAKRHEGARMVKSLSAAAGDSWREIKQTADALLAEAKATATSVIERFRSALGG